MWSNSEKNPWTNLQNSYKNLSKEIKSENFCYRKVERVITKWGAIEKSQVGEFSNVDLWSKILTSITDENTVDENIIGLQKLRNFLYPLKMVLFLLLPI